MKAEGSAAGNISLWNITDPANRNDEYAIGRNSFHTSKSSSQRLALARAFLLFLFRYWLELVKGYLRRSI